MRAQSSAALPLTRSDPHFVTHDLAAFAILANLPHAIQVLAVTAIPQIRLGLGTNACRTDALITAATLSSPMPPASIADVRPVPTMRRLMLQSCVRPSTPT